MGWRMRITVVGLILVGLALLGRLDKVEGEMLIREKVSDNKTLAEILSWETFDGLFPHRNSLSAHAQSFWTYDSFIAAASLFEKEGFAVSGGQDMQKRELAAFFAHVAHETTCGWSNALGGPYAWGLCYNQELAPSSLYCKHDEVYSCVNGVSYHGRGALTVYWNFNYGPIGRALGFDGLHHPEYLSNNATLAWASAIWLWMTPFEPIPSPHNVLFGEWKPTKNDTDAYRFPGFGMTTNILAGQVECGHGPDPRGQDRISHYNHFVNYFGVSESFDNLDCGLQGMLPALNSRVAFGKH